MNKYPAEIFKAYDIRGIVDQALTEEVICDIGKVLGSMAKIAKVKGIAVGYDGRLSSPRLAKNLINGILSAGCDVYDIGEVATPMVYFANYELETYSGIMITGSHNPPQYNGLKMVLNGSTLFGEQIQQILQALETKNYQDGFNNATCHKIDINDKYIKRIVGDVKLSRKVKLIVDCGNGVAGKIAPKLYKELGAEVKEMFCEVDGNFPNHHPDPSDPKNLKDLIQALDNSEFEVGFAFDGDGDRLGVVTSDGNIIYPDRQLMLFSEEVLKANPGAKIIYDVKSSGLLNMWITDHGGIPVMCKTGHSFIKQEIKQTKAKLAGEMSGHVFFNDRWYGFDDGIYAGARLLEILSKSANPSKLLNDLPCRISTPEINIKVTEGTQHQIIETLKQNAKFSGSQEVITLDGLRVEYPNGFGLVRASNTTPVLVLRFEATTNQGLNEIMGQFKQVLKSCVNIDM